MDLREIDSASGQAHPWETARLGFFLRVLGQHAPPTAHTRVLDVGAGDAMLAAEVQTTFGVREITCWDESYTAREIDSLRLRHPYLRLTAEEPDDAFDLVLMMDVLEHVEDDEAFLGRIVEGHLSRSGHLLVSVPAQPLLWTSHDRFLHHFRRYRAQDARALLRGSGLRILTGGGLFHSLIAPRFFQALRERIAGPAPEPSPQLRWTAPPSVTRLTLSALSLDNRLSQAAASRGVDLPGLSWWALCVRETS